jgi:predicted nucleic-acid-binding Zn-ribbon protein
MAECPRCGGEMREGEALMRFTTSVGQVSSSFDLLSMPGMGVPTGEQTIEEKIFWREKTGKKTGWLVKSDERKNLKISGLRCTECGYIELYAKE